MSFLIRILRILLIPIILSWLLRSFFSDMQRNRRGSWIGGSWEDFLRQRRNFTGGSASGDFSWQNQSAWEIFDLPRSASDEDIKKRYRKLVAQYHPDRFSGLGDKDFSDLAARKFQRIQQAWEELKRVRGL